MFEKLEDVEKRFEEVSKKISDPEVIARQSEWQKLMKEHAAMVDVVEREELLNNIWGYDFVGESRALDVHIRSLRAKLGDDGHHYIKTIRSVGYRFIEDGQ